MSNYIPRANWSEKDALNSGELLKKVSATEIGTEFDEISTMSTTKAEIAGDSAQDFNANDTTVNNLTVSGDLAVTGELTGVLTSDTGYTQIGDLIIQWGATTAGTGTITLPIEFVGTDYSATVTDASSHGSYSNYALMITNKTTTTFNIEAAGAGPNFNWIAIGY